MTRKRRTDDEEARLTALPGVPKTPQGWRTAGLAVLAVIVAVVLALRWIG